MDTEIKACSVILCTTAWLKQIYGFTGLKTSPVQVPWMFRLQAWHQHRSYPSSLHQLTIPTPPHLLCAKPETLRCLLRTARRFNDLFLPHCQACFGMANLQVASLPMWPLCGLRVKQTTVQQKLPSSHHFGKPKSLATRMRNIDGFIQKEFVFDPLHKVQQTIFCGLSARKARIFSSVSSCKSLLDSRVDLKLPATLLANNTIYILHTHHNVIQIQVYLQLSYLSFTLSTALRQSCLLRSASWHLYAKCGTETKLPWDLQQGGIILPIANSFWSSPLSRT